MAGKENVFHKYPNKYFIETGSYYGDGIQKALDSGAFEKIISIEITPKYYEICKERFKDNENVRIILGDSVKELSKAIRSIRSPITFWLDGHYTEPTTDFSDIGGWFPLMQELDIIKKHKLKNHCIIIDDIRLFNPSYCFFNKHNIFKKDIVEKVMEINSEYKIIYEDGTAKDDILVTTIE